MDHAQSLRVRAERVGRWLAPEQSGAAAAAAKSLRRNIYNALRVHAVVFIWAHLALPNTMAARRAQAACNPSKGLRVGLLILRLLPDTSEQVEHAKLITNAAPTRIHFAGSADDAIGGGGGGASDAIQFRAPEVGRCCCATLG